jgi:hypothetical protein
MRLTLTWREFGPLKMLKLQGRYGTALEPGYIDGIPLADIGNPAPSWDDPWFHIRSWRLFFTLSRQSALHQPQKFSPDEG